MCRINTLSEEELTKELKKSAVDLKITRRIPFENEFPEYFVGFKLESYEAVGQKFRKFVINHERMLVKLEDEKLKVITLKKVDKKAK